MPCSSCMYPKLKLHFVNFVSPMSSNLFSHTVEGDVFHFLGFDHQKLQIQHVYLDIREGATLSIQVSPWFGSRPCCNCFQSVACVTTTHKREKIPFFNMRVRTARSGPPFPQNCLHPAILGAQSAVSDMKPTGHNLYTVPFAENLEDSLFK